MCISLSGWSAWPSLLRPACATSVAHKSQAGLGAADEEKEEGEDDRQNSKLWFLTRGQENSEGQRSLRLPKLWIRFIIWTINVQNNPITATFHTSQFFDPGVANVPDFRFANNVVRTIRIDL